MCPNDEKSARNEFLEAVSGGSITSELRNRVRNSQIGLCEGSFDSVPQFIWGMSVNSTQYVHQLMTGYKVGLNFS